jgi:uncharacterized protein
MYRKTALHLLRVGAFALVLAGLPGLAFAQAQPSAAQIQIARDVVEASGAARAFDPIVPTILQQAINAFVPQNPDLQKPIVESVQTIAPAFEKRRSEIIDIVARVYATKFTEAELKEILVFYRSTVGKKFVAVQPAVLEDSFRRTQEWSAKISEEIVTALRAEMKKRGHTI